MKLCQASRYNWGWADRWDGKRKVPLTDWSVLPCCFTNCHAKKSVTCHFVTDAELHWEYNLSNQSWTQKSWWGQTVITQNRWDIQGIWGNATCVHKESPIKLHSFRKKVTKLDCSRGYVSQAGHCEKLSMLHSHLLYICCGKYCFQLHKPLCHLLWSCTELDNDLWLHCAYALRESRDY